MKHVKLFEEFILEKKPKGAPDFHHSDAPDADGRFKDLSIKDLAAWLIKTRKKDLKKIVGSLNQQIVFNRNDDAKYAEKMEKTRKEVYKQLDRQDLIDKMDESTLNEVNTIECNNCDWSWRLQDGGDDVYTCHNCGYDNTPQLGEGIINEQETYKDYPAAAKANAKKAIKWKEEHGRDEVKGGTAVGWARAHQLAKGEALSKDVVSRMAQFNRHRKNSSIKPELKDEPWKDNGYIAWLIWGGDAGVDWAIKKMKQINEE